ncbi:hypothetical protein ACLOJK_040533 [Asimina triloba]
MEAAYWPKGRRCRSSWVSNPLQILRRRVRLNLAAELPSRSPAVALISRCRSSSSLGRTGQTHPLLAIHHRRVRLIIAHLSTLAMEKTKVFHGSEDDTEFESSETWKTWMVD